VGATAAIAMSMKKERDVRDAFRAAGATTPVNAMSLEAVGIEETMAVRRLKRRAVIREAAPGLFYFDEDVYLAVSSMRRRIALLLVGTLVLMILVLTWGTVAIK
jgi:hypothetical protein